MEQWGLPDPALCRKLKLKDSLYCRKSHVVRSKIGVCGKAFDKAVAAGLLEPVVLAGEKYNRYYTAQVLDIWIR